MKESTVETSTSAIALFNQALQQAYTYTEYRNLVASHVERGTSTGPEQSEALSQYTLLNDSRMRRLDKTTIIPSEIKRAFQQFEGNQTWLVLTESWCGDAAQSMPMMNALAETSENITFRVALRDQHVELMQHFLTNESMSIPKLIVFDSDSQTILGDWGPRPTTATEMAQDYKEKHGSLSASFKHELQIWYNKDKGVNTAQDLRKFVR